MMTIDTTNMCSLLQRELFEEDGIYKTPRGYHKRSMGSNEGMRATGCQSLLNQPLLCYAHEITNPVLLIHQVAYKLGFQYPQHFTRLFKQQLGVTPTEYRN